MPSYRSASSGTCSTWAAQEALPSGIGPQMSDTLTPSRLSKHTSRASLRSRRCNHRLRSALHRSRSRLLYSINILSLRVTISYRRICIAVSMLHIRYIVWPTYGKTDSHEHSMIVVKPSSGSNPKLRYPPVRCMFHPIVPYILLSAVSYPFFACPSHLRSY